MANNTVKISALIDANSTTASDLLMFVQNGSNKKITLANLLSHLDSSVTVNSKYQDVNFIVNGSSQSNLIYTSAVKNAVGILTNNPLDAALHSFGDIRVGGYDSIDRKVYKVDVGALDSAGTGFKTVTFHVTPQSPLSPIPADSISSIYNINDIVLIKGMNISDVNGYKKIISVSTYSFTVSILNTVNTTTLNTVPINALAQRISWKPGVFKSSIEQLTHSSAIGGYVTIGADFSVTGLTVTGSCYFNLSLTGGVGQEKYIYLKATPGAGKATIENINGLGFTRIEFFTAGDGVTLTYDGDKWVCLGYNGAVVTNV